MKIVEHDTTLGGTEERIATILAYFVFLSIGTITSATNVSIDFIDIPFITPPDTKYHDIAVGD